MIIKSIFSKLAKPLALFSPRANSFSFLTTTRNFELNKQEYSNIFLRKDWNPQEIIETENDEKPIISLFNDSTQNSEIYEMAFKKRLVALKKRRRRKHGKAITSRYR